MTASFLLVWAAVAGAGVTIDNFDNGNVIYSGPGSSNEPAVAGTLGGNRATALDIGSTGLEINDPGGVLDSTGFLAFGNDPGIAGTLTLNYTASPGADLTNGGSDDRIAFDFLSSDQPATLTVELTDGSANSHLVTKPVATGAYTLEILLSEFTGVDVSNVTAAEITLKPNNDLGGDYFLDIIETAEPPPPPNGRIPEPAGLALLAGGLLGFAVRKRRSS